MEFAQIWVILKAESCWAALILYRIEIRARYMIQHVQSIYLGDTPGDTSQPCYFDINCYLI